MRVRDLHWGVLTTITPLFEARADMGPSFGSSFYPIALGILGILILIPKPKLKKIPVRKSDQKSHSQKK